MATKHTVEIVESYKITSWGVIVEIKHDLNGLPSGTKLKSASTGLHWVVKKRIIFTHAADKQKRFSNEAEEFHRGIFKPIENIEKSIASILAREDQNIYQYSLESDVTENKPAVGEILEVE